MSDMDSVGAAFTVARIEVPAGGHISDLFGINMLVQAAIGGCVDDHITEHAEMLVESLDDRGPAAWFQACAHVTELLAAMNAATGPEGAAAFRASYNPAVKRWPAMLHALELQASWIAGGPPGFNAYASALPHAELRDGTRALVAFAIAAAGWGQRGPIPPLFDALIPKPTTTPEN